LREHAVVLTDHTIAKAACTPSRASIMTGLYGPWTGVTRTDGMFNNGDPKNFPWLKARGADGRQRQVRHGPAPRSALEQGLGRLAPPSLRAVRAVLPHTARQHAAIVELIDHSYRRRATHLLTF
jgi:hypothetical protein